MMYLSHSLGDVVIQVGPGYVVGARLEVKGDALAKKEKL